MEITEVLVLLEHDVATAGVVRDTRGELWLTDSLNQLCGIPLSDYRPRHLGLTGDRTLVGGRLAPGAVSAVVVDDAGQRHEAIAGRGAWIAVLDQPIQAMRSPVCYRNADRELVAPPLPAAWARSPVIDATEPCPACGHVIWDQLTPSVDWHGLRGTPDGSADTNLIVSCRTCGHEESVGVIVHLTRPPAQDRDDVARRIRDANVRILKRKHDVIATLDFPVYAAAGWRAALVGSGGSSGATTRVTVGHGVRADQPGPVLHIQTAQNEQFRLTEVARARQELERWLLAEQPRLPANRSDASLAVAGRTGDRQRRQAAAETTRQRTLIQIDGRPESFTVVRAGNRWVAVRQRITQTITLSANEIHPATISLEAMTAPMLRRLLLTEQGE